MKITKITINFDNGATAEYQDPKGVDLGDIPDMIGLSPDSISDAATDTLPGLVSGLLTGVIGLLMKRYGLEFSSK